MKNTSGCCILWIYGKEKHEQKRSGGCRRQDANLIELAQGAPDNMSERGWFGCVTWADAIGTEIMMSTKLGTDNLDGVSY